MIREKGLPRSYSHIAKGGDDDKDEAYWVVVRNQCFEKAKEIKPFKLEDFKDHYGEETINEDKKTVERIEEKIRQKLETEQSPWSVILEAIICEQVEKGSWFEWASNENLNREMYSFRASRYDDLVNKIDLGIECSEEEKSHYLAIGIDVTWNPTPESFDDKVEPIKKNIEKGELSEIKYFESQVNGEKRN